MVEEQKMKKVKSTQQILRRLTGEINPDILNQINIEQDYEKENLLEESFHDHFNNMKNDDSMNEGIPLQFLKQNKQ